MAGTPVLPARGDVFWAPATALALRLSWHHGAEIVVFSLRRRRTCVAIFQLTKDDVPGLVDSLVGGVTDEPRGPGAVPRRAIRGPYAGSPPTAAPLRRLTRIRAASAMREGLEVVTAERLLL